MRFTMHPGGASNVTEITNGMASVSMDTDASVSCDNQAQFSGAGASKSIIITNISEQIFDNDFLKKQFEALFTHIDSSAVCHYLKSFRRARVTFSRPSYATEAIHCVHDNELCGQKVKCFYAQPLVLKRTHESPTLQPPVPEKQFLISPPASPPVDWEPIHEGEPVINYDLLSAMASLAPGEAHQLHPASAEQPGIVVHICEDPAGYGNRSIEQTRRPHRG